MKKFSMVLSFLLAAGVAVASAQTAAKSTAATPATKTAAALKTHNVAGEFVAYDAAKKMLTLKTDSGETTAPVKGRALTQVKSFKAGDQVVVTCRDKADGTHEAAIGIKKAVKTASK